MRTRALGDTGITVGEIGLGCGGLGLPGRDGLDEVLEYAFEHGVTFYDTADMYGHGRSEEILGRVFAGRREQIVLATKFGTVIRDDGTYYKDFSAAHMREAFEGSLRRLRTEYVDVYQMHNPPMSVLEDRELLDGLDSLVEERKIRCYGISIDSTREAVRFLEETRGRSIQININLFSQGCRNFLDEAPKRGAGVIIKVPLAGGTLAGRFTTDYPPPDDDRRKRWGEDDFARRLELAQKVRPVLEAAGRTMSQGALAWLLSFDAVSVVIPGITSLDKVKDSIAAGGMRLSPDEMSRLDEMEDGLLRGLKLGW